MLMVPQWWPHCRFSLQASLTPQCCSRVSPLLLLATVNAVNMGARGTEEVIGPLERPLAFAGGVIPLAAAGTNPEEAPFAEPQLATDLSITALRLGTCVLMVHHGIDKLDHVDGFTASVVAVLASFPASPPSGRTPRRRRRSLALGCSASGSSRVRLRRR